jgi:hypothetical protein
MFKSIRTRLGHGIYRIVEGATYQLRLIHYLTF